VNLPYSWLDINNRRSFQRATEFLLDLGHRRIALINGLDGMDFSARRQAGYLAALDARGIAADPDLIAGREMTEFHGHRVARAMLALDRPPTAFLVSSMISAIGVRRALHDLSLTMGREISVITHDDDLGYLKNGDDVPLFTATRSSVREAGSRAAEMLLDLIADPASGPKSRLLEADLIIGQSTGPVLP
jgi:LacI family transcriptional regulator